MIPLLFRLRDEVLIEKSGGSHLVVTEVPLNVLRVNERTVHILRLCDGERTPGEIARESGLADEAEVFRICESLNRRGILEVELARTDEYTPSVTVIVPTRDRKNELGECLESVFSQDYPKDRLEVIVVDDGSQDDTRGLLRTLPCKIISHGESRGQSYCRNRGAEAAQGEILAFIDSDCVPSVTWLKELMPSFQWDEVGAVGGFVDGYFDESRLDRYEKAFSSLNMGKHIASSAAGASTLYVPTCNLLVRRGVYAKVGGIAEEMKVGEDVDFCWRMRSNGYRLLYLPCGAVRHKHRNVLPHMLRRRAQYGTSEALLHARHPEKKKVLQIPPLAIASFIALCAALISLSPFPALATAAGFLTDWVLKARRLGRASISVSQPKILFSLLRTYLSLFYFVSFHVIRYYTVLLLFLGLLLPQFWLLCLSMVLFISVVDYRLKRPQLGFLPFLFYYFLEHIAYQIGVFIGCAQRQTFGGYSVKFVRRLP
jgi:mycofactocin glycosyltransferase